MKANMSIKNNVRYSFVLSFKFDINSTQYGETPVEIAKRLSEEEILQVLLVRQNIFHAH